MAESARGDKYGLVVTCRPEGHGSRIALAGSHGGEPSGFLVDFAPPVRLTVNLNLGSFINVIYSTSSVDFVMILQHFAAEYLLKCMRSRWANGSWWTEEA